MPEKTISFTLRTAAIMLLLAFLAGLGGGYVGAIKAIRKSPTQNGFSKQNISVQEDSAIIDVVKKTGPAVVSIIISQDVNKYFSQEMDPFSPFFGFGYSRNYYSQNQNQTPNFQQVGAGSGFLVSAEGLILTNKHVVSDETAKYTVITQDKKKYEATVLARDPRGDLAILKIDIHNAPFLNIADSGSLQIGQKVIAIGNSLGQYPNTVTSGIISGIGRSVTAGGQEGSEQLSGVIQTDAAINPGNSGGPLLDLGGNVVGINTAIDSQGQLVGFAIPSNDASKALASYTKNGKITRPYLGVRYVLIDKDTAKSQNLPKDFGALIIRGQTQNDLAVIPGSPADKAGITENDIILEADGKQINTEYPLAEALKNKSAGDEVTLKFYHKGDEKTVKVKLEDSK